MRRLSLITPIIFCCFQTIVLCQDVKFIREMTMYRTAVNELDRALDPAKPLLDPKRAIAVRANAARLLWLSDPKEASAIFQ